jgi:cytochrome c
VTGIARFWRCALQLGVFGGALIAAGASIGQDSKVAAPFTQCAVCHSVDGSKGTGPTLKGVIGRESGSVPGFRYSRAMKGAQITWDDQSLDRYLADPQEFVPGNAMPFSGLSDAAERAEIIAYLKTLR